MVDGDSAIALLSSPIGLVFDRSGDLLVYEAKGAIRKISPNGEVTTIIKAEVTHVNNVSYANLPKPKTPVDEGRWCLAFGNDGTLYASDEATIQIIPQSGETRRIGIPKTPGFQDGSVQGALFGPVRGVTVDSAGTIYVLEGWADDKKKDCTIRKVTPDGIVTTIPLEDKIAPVQSTIVNKVTAQNAKKNHKVKAPKKAAQKLATKAAQAIFVGITADSGGDLLLTGTNGEIYSFDLSGDIAPVADAGATGKIALDAAGNLFCYVNPYSVRKVMSDGRVTTLHQWNQQLDPVLAKAINKQREAGLATVKETLLGKHQICLGPSDLAVDNTGLVYVANDGGLEQIAQDGSDKIVIKASSGIYSVATAPDGEVYVLAQKTICHVSKEGVLTPIPIKSSDTRLTLSAPPLSELVISQRGEFILCDSENNILYKSSPALR